MGHLFKDKVRDKEWGTGEQGEKEKRRNQRMIQDAERSGGQLWDQQLRLAHRQAFPNMYTCWHSTSQLDQAHLNLSCS